MTATFFSPNEILELNLPMLNSVELRKEAEVWDRTLKEFRGWEKTEWGGFFNLAKAIYPTRMIMGYIMANHLIQVLASKGAVIVADERAILEEELRRFDDDFDDASLWYWIGRINEELKNYRLPEPPALSYREFAPAVETTPHPSHRELVAV